MDIGTYLDVDETDNPANLEIVDVAGRMGIDKDCFISLGGQVNIAITEDMINVEVVFKFKNEMECLQLNAINDFDIPNGEINFALV